MRSLLVLALVLAASTAVARDNFATCETDTSLKSLVADPKAYVGKDVIIPRVRCVDPGGAKFVCTEPVGGQAIRIEAFALGRWTSDEIVDQLISDCKGTANLSRPECTFRVAIKPSSAAKLMEETSAGSLMFAHIFAPQIEFYEPIDRCR